TTNPNATFGRSSGGQIAFVTKRGANDVHGSAYWYHQNDNLNANSWDRNRLARKPDGTPAVPEPELKDNRFGGSLGGPIWRDRTFLFGNYEGRRFPREVDVLRLVPSNALRQGILQFRDGGGAVVSYDLKTSRLCGPNGDQLCDPRSVGLNPVIKSVWDLLPPGNDPAAGDGLNTIGFRSTASASTTSDFAVARLDHKLTEKWNLEGSYRWFRQTAFSPTQLDIAGLLPGSAKGKATSVGAIPVRAAFYVGGLTGQLTPTLINETRVSFVRDWWWLTRADPRPQISGTNVALQIAGASPFGGLLDQPVDVHTQLARTQGVNDKIFQVIDNLTWVKGGHTMQLGGSFRRLHLYHLRNDKVVGSLSALVAEVDDQSAITINPEQRPRECGPGVTTNCLQAGDLTRWNRLYTGALGMVDNIGVMIVRDGQLKAKPIGTALEVDALISAHEYYINDTWRLRPNLTFTLGLSYQWQTPPKELEGRQTFLIDEQTKKIISSGDYLSQRRRASEAGDIFNPSIAFQTIRESGRDGIFDIDRKNIGPRLSFAWTPGFSQGFLERLTGGSKTVLRGGYGIVFDRLNTVQTVVIPLLGVGFAQTINCRGPRSDKSCQNLSDPTNAFRIGVDGLAPIPPVPSATSPVVPSSPFGELLSFQVDPDITVGRSHSVDFTIQRELRGGFLIEAGYTGRFGRNLNQNLQINAVPFFMKDRASGQTFAQAFDTAATQLRGSTLATNVTPQNWFENQLNGATFLINNNPTVCGPGKAISCTAALAITQTAAFRDGLLNDLWTAIQFARPGGPITNLQVLDNWVRTDGGRSNYNALFVTVRKRFSKGLAFDVNYTLSKALDQAGLIQNFIGTFSSPYDRDIDYGPAFFDRRHVLNGNGYYELPFGDGKRWSAGRYLNKVAGGWYVSGIFTFNTGLPLTVAQSNQVWGGDPLNFSVAAGAIPTGGKLGSTVRSGVNGSINAGSLGDSSKGGSGLNIFSNPEQALNSFRKIRISEDGRSERDGVRGLKRVNTDISIGKKTNITEQIRTVFTADFLNVFNRLELNDPILNLLNPAAFGVLSQQFNLPRAVQLGLRFEW
ncbi:MAG: hypothetical protein MOB07_07485, partial [Acidobacteria bacterium]|nr:hypothetical protein [Acidobacteriota bacterium]